MKTIVIDDVAYKLEPLVQQEVFNDWRLPTIEELSTLINYNKFDPASDLADAISNYYWSSTTYASYSSSAWLVYFGNGNQFSYDKENDYYVRCVRDGADGLEWSKSSTTKMNWEEAMQYANSLEESIYYKEPRCNALDITTNE